MDEVQSQERRQRTPLRTEELRERLTFLDAVRTASVGIGICVHRDAGVEVRARQERGDVQWIQLWVPVVPVGEEVVHGAGHRRRHDLPETGDQHAELQVHARFLATAAQQRKEGAQILVAQCRPSSEAARPERQPLLRSAGPFGH